MLLAQEEDEKVGYQNEDTSIRITGRRLITSMPSDTISH